jgi:hypothetical protein
MSHGLSWMFSEPRAHFRVDIIFSDGFSRRYIGPKGVLLRRNPEHIERTISAIRQRFDNETEITIEESHPCSKLT